MDSAREISIITLDHINVSFGTSRILHDISWSLLKGQHWLISGPNGSGKTTFLRLLYGDVHPDPDGRGRRSYCFGGRISRSSVGVRKHVSMVTSILQEAYLRYSWDVTGLEAVISGLAGGVWLSERPSPETVSAADPLFERFGIRHLRDKTVLEMSQGEMRKILIARALILQPSVLLFDDFCAGLDMFSRLAVLDAVGQAAALGVHVLFATNREQEIPAFLTHHLRLDAGRIRSGGARRTLSRVPPACGDTKPARTSALKDVAARFGDARATALPQNADPEPAESLGIEKCDVYLGRKKILHSISWHIMENQNWLVMGRNGSGKSTLAKLITGGLYPAYGGRIRRFGSDGAQSVWEIRKKIGLVSPELQAQFPSSLLGYEVIQSGLFSSVGIYHELDEDQQGMIEEWIELFEIQRLCSSVIGQLSYGEMRKLLIVRSLVNRPLLLILDEPCSGLDSDTRAEILKMIDYLGSTRLQIILITHQTDEIISCVSHAMILHGGAVAASGTLAEVLTADTISRFILGKEPRDENTAAVAPCDCYP